MKYPIYLNGIRKLQISVIFSMFIIIIKPNISKWNTDKVIDMNFMYSYCTSLIFIPDISKWNTDNVIDMSFMFSHYSLLDDLPDI